MKINIDELKSWIGNDEIAFDEVSQGLETRFRATLDEDPGNPQKGDLASSGLHWALAPAIVKSSLLGKDSHPQKGEFLPPIPLPRRMWAGCRTHFLNSLKISRVSFSASLEWIIKGIFKFIAAFICVSKLFICSDFLLLL